MNWMIEFMGILVTATLTGSGAFLVWRLLCIFLKKWGYAKWCRAGLWAVGTLYMLPVVYMGMLWSRENGRWGGILFWPTQAISNVSRCLFLVWGVGAGIRFYKLLSAYMFQRKVQKAQVSCEREVQEMFDAVCRETGLKPGKVALVWDYRAKVPAFTGIMHPRVVLPVCKFTREQLRMIFLHELTHYKQRDIYLLMLAMLVQIVHWFQPFARLLRKSVMRYSEFVCDEKVCSRAGGRKVYFDMIFDVMCTLENQDRLFSMHMIEDKNELVRRKKYMRDVEKRGKKPMVCAVLLSVGMVMSCSMTVAAAADGIGRQYQKWFNQTEIVIEEDVSEPTIYEEFTDNGSAEDIRIEMGETEQSGRSTGFEWTVKGKTKKQTSGFSAKKGQKISVNVWVDPTTKNINVGIIDSSGTRTYVTGKDNINHDFSITKSDTYRVFVENTNTTSVDVDGSYTVR